MMHKKIILALISYWHTCYAQVIVFDLNNVLIAQDSKAIIDALGWRNITKYTLFERKNPFNLPRKLDLLLDEIPTIAKKSYSITEALERGALSYQELLRAAFIYLEDLKVKNKSESILEIDLLEKLLGILYHPQTHINYLYALPDALELVKRIAQKTDEHDTPCHTLIILTSHSPENIDLLYDAPHLKKLFKFFARRHVVATSDLACTKNQRHSAEHFFDRFNLNPKDCIFIDTNEKFIKYVSKKGALGILVSKKNITNALQDLLYYGVIS